MRLGGIGGFLFLFAMWLVVSDPFSAMAQAEPGILGARRYLQFCAACHGTDGRGGDKAASLVTSETIRASSDEDLFRIIHDGTAEGMPPFAQIGGANIEVLVHFLRVLQGGRTAQTKHTEPVAADGDPDTGRKLYFGKAQCGSCHRVQGQGAYVASDLTSYGRVHDIDAILRAMTDPAALPASSPRLATVTTVKGQTLTGVVRNEDAFSVDLQTRDGRYYLFARSELVRVSGSGYSFMPRDYSQLLSPRELEDITKFLLLAAKTAPRTSVQR